MAMLTLLVEKHANVVVPESVALMSQFDAPTEPAGFPKAGVGG